MNFTFFFFLFHQNRFRNRPAFSRLEYSRQRQFVIAIIIRETPSKIRLSQPCLGPTKTSLFENTPD